MTSKIQCLIRLKSTRCFVVLCLIATASNFVCAQVPSIQWQKCYGGSGYDGANSVCQTADGGFLLGGYSNSSDSQVTGSRGDQDCWLVRTDATGNIIWQKSYGGSGADFLDQSTVDINGGFMFAAATSSNDGDVSGNHGGMDDGWLVKTDDTGHIVWQHVMGSSDFDFFNAIINTPDSGYIAVGAASAADGDISGLHGNADVWVVRLSKTGAVLWSKVYGGPNYDYAFNIINTADHGFMVACNIYGSGGQVTTGFGMADIWLLKLDDTGGILWQKTYGGNYSEIGGSVLQMASGNYVVGCSSASTTGQVTGNHGNLDYWLFAINDTGGLLWERSYGGAGNEELGDNIVQTFDGGFLASGFTTGCTGDVTEVSSPITGGADFWVLKVNVTGAIVWENAFGGSSRDSGVCVIQTLDSGYAVAGGTTSHNYDVGANHGTEDYWLLKLAKEPPLKVIPSVGEGAVSVYPTLTNGIVYLEWPDGTQPAESHISLSDISGRDLHPVLYGSGSKRWVRFSDLPVGMYILRVGTGGTEQVFKIVREY